MGITVMLIRVGYKTPAISTTRVRIENAVVTIFEPAEKETVDPCRWNDKKSRKKAT